jgi:glucose/arabinose dehydrogenase
LTRHQATNYFFKLRTGKPVNQLIKQERKMNMIKSVKLLLVLSLLILNCNELKTQTSKKIHPEIWVRQGYELSVAVNSELKPRHMALGPYGTLYYSTTPGEQIIAAKDKDNDGYFESLTEFHKSGSTVYNVLWNDGWLWYSENGAIYKLKDSNDDGIADEKLTVFPEGSLPSGGGHSWRPILIHKDRLYTSIGDGGNISDQVETDRQKIWSFDLDGKNKKLWSSGIRNTEKLVIRPGTDEIWGMDHGSDWFGKELGDDRDLQPITDYNPPCEMNKYIEGGFYGHPFIVGNKLPRYEYMNREDIIELAAKTIVPEWCSGAHWAPNGMMFYTGDQFPEEHKGDAFVAYHGSWNRSVKSGYQVTRVLFENGKPYGEKAYVKFITSDQKVLGRPVDVIQAPDGTLLISEDGSEEVDGFKQNIIYRLKYTGK